MTWTIRRVSKRAPDGTAYDLIGPVGAQCVVLVHGLGLSRALWDSALDAFKGYRILRYDLFGHGHSSPAPESASLRMYARQIADLLDHLSISAAHIVGFSIGGMINRRFALDYPDRTLSLVILNSPHDRGAQGQDAVEARALAARAQGAFATFDAAIERWFTPAAIADGTGPKRVRAWREQVDDESYAQASWVLAHGVRELVAPRPSVHCPTLIITSAHDVGSTPDMSRAISGEIAGSEVIVVPGYKHLGLLEDTATFLGPTMDFLNTLPEPPL